MSSCDHISWLQLTGNQTLILNDTGRLDRVINELADPAQQTPTLLYFLGRRAKDAALKEIFPHNNLRRGRSNGLANIRVDTASITRDSPLIFADSDLGAPIPPRESLTPCHKSTAYPIHWPYSNTQSALDVAFIRILLPFCSALVLFVDDFDSLGQIALYIERWTTIGMLLDDVRPRLILAASAKSTKYSRIQLRQLQDHCQQSQLFSSISLVLLIRELSATSCHRPLREEISKQAGEMLQILSRHHRLFSALHLAHMYRLALKHTAGTVTEAFDYVQASRTYHNLANYPGHLKNFLTLAVKHAISYESITSYLASGMIMDAYPPGAHGKFSISPSKDNRLLAT